MHPLHFLYCKFHADIAPIGGHDGYAAPGGDSEYHYLHHAKYECNYGVPFPIDFDSIFGTWRTFADYNLPDPNRTSAPPTCEPNGNWQSVRPRLRSPTGKREK